VLSFAATAADTERRCPGPRPRGASATLGRPVRASRSRPV